MERLSHEDFFSLPLTDIEARTGLEVPANADEAAERDYRERAWESYKQDIANKDEWGGTEGESIPKGDTDDL
jgi:hypothetical protein